MSFDALTIGGFLAAIVSGGFLVAVVRNNGRALDADNGRPAEDASLAQSRR
jgi:hypothetical protein